jgi:hypothetical protein
VSTIARRIASSPKRTASECWEFISQLICGTDSTALAEFKAMEGVASALIADYAFQRSPLIIQGVGDKLKVYCVYDRDALEDDTREDALSWSPTNGEWAGLIPCVGEQFAWAIPEIKKRSKRFRAYSEDSEKEQVAEKTVNLKINAEAFRKL